MVTSRLEEFGYLNQSFVLELIEELTAFRFFCRENLHLGLVSLLSLSLGGLRHLFDQIFPYRL